MKTLIAATMVGLMSFGVMAAEPAKKVEAKKEAKATTATPAPTAPAAPAVKK
jgi:hypothetical protein